MGLSDRIAYSGNRNTVTTETNRAKQCQVTHLRTTWQRIAQSYLTSVKHTLEAGPYGHNCTVMASPPAASISPVPQARSLQRCNTIYLLRGNSAFPKMQTT